MIDLIRQGRPNDAPPRLVLNQIGVPGRPEIPAKDFGAALGVHASLMIPFDAKTFGAAANNGQMILDAGAKTKAAEAFQTLAQIVSRRELPAVAGPKGKIAKPAKPGQGGQGGQARRRRLQVAVRRHVQEALTDVRQAHRPARRRPAAPRDPPRRPRRSRPSPCRCFRTEGAPLAPTQTAAPAYAFADDDFEPAAEALARADARHRPQAGPRLSIDWTPWRLARVPKPEAPRPATNGAGPKPTAGLEQLKKAQAVAEIVREQSDYYHATKTTIFNALMNTIDLSQLAQLDQKAASEEIRDIVSELVAIKNVSMSVAEQEHLVQDIVNDVSGLWAAGAPAEPRRHRPTSWSMAQAGSSSRSPARSS